MGVWRRQISKVLGVSVGAWGSGGDELIKTLDGDVFAGLRTNDRGPAEEFDNRGSGWFLLFSIKVTEILT